MAKTKVKITTDYKNVKVEPNDITSGEVLSKEFYGENRLQWLGEGAFDVLMHAIDENLRIQYDNGRILGDTYAQAYIQLVSAAIDKSVDLAIANAELKLKIAELELKENQADEDEALNKLKQEQLRAQTKVYDRQIEGFSDNLKLKLLQSQLESFSMIFASGMLDFNENAAAFPKALKASSLSEVYDDLRASSLTDWEAKKKYKVENRIEKGGEPSGIEL